MSSTAFRDLLVEVGCEELPTWAVRLILDQLREEMPKFLQQCGLAWKRYELFSTPRRITLLFDQLQADQEERKEIVTGPPRSAAYDAQGRPTRAALGFAAKCGVEVDTLQLTRTAKGEYLTHTQVVPGRTASALLAEFLPSVLSRIQFKKPMHWDDSHYSFIRPIRWILALHGEEAFALQIAAVSSASTTHGHRMLGRRNIPIHSPSEYFQILRDNYVLVDPLEREKRILEQLHQTAGELGGRLLPDPELLKEVVFLNEYPKVIAGSIPEEFLKLPPEVLTPVLRKHQKYFSVAATAEERLLPHFMAVIDMDQDRQGAIRQGHERVLQARLKDATFFWKGDQSRSLSSRVETLARYQFHVKLGSYFEKTERMRLTGRRIAESLGRTEILADLDRACSLCKADLATDMVREFPELQGIMGGLYAECEGLPASVAQAIYDQYKPQNLDDAVPRSLLGALLSMADRADTLAGCFGVGMIPKGSSDPFALRRHAHGILKILWEHRLPLSMDQILEAALETLRDRLTRSAIEVSRDLKTFFEGRMRYMLQQRELSYDVINAVLKVGADIPLDVLDRAQAVQAIRPEPDFEALAVASKRVKNILSDQEESGLPEISLPLLSEEEEKQLHAGLNRVEATFHEHVRHGRYDEALRLLASLRPEVDRFFDKVLVMAPEAPLRNNRLSLLAALSRLFGLIADIAEIVPGPAETAASGSRSSEGESA